MRRFIVLMVVCCLWPQVLWASPPGAEPYDLQVVPWDGKPAKTVTAWTIAGVVFLPGDLMAEVLGGSYSWWSELGKLTLNIDGHTLELIEQSEFAVIDGETVFPLPAAVFLWESRMLVPLALLVDEQGAARPWIEAPLKFNRRDQVLQASQITNPTLIEIQVIQDALGWKLSFTADQPFKSQLFRTERASMMLRLKDVSYDPMFVLFPTEHPWFQGLRLRAMSTGIEVLFSAGVLPRGYRLIQSHDQKTTEILLGVDERDIRTGRLTPFAVPRGRGNLQLRRLVLDPGHDGSTPGGDLAYAICLELAEVLSEDLGLEVLVTHAQDRNPSSEARVRRANEASGDLFVSLHIHDRPGGPTAFVGQPAMPAPMDRELSRLGFRSYYASQEGHAQMSRAVAQDLVQAVADQMGLPPGGVFPEALPELQGALMPAVLVEFGLGESSWDSEERTKIVEGLSTAIKNHYWRSGP